MTIELGGGDSRPFVPRPQPFAIPPTNWNDTPTWCLRVNDEWGAHVLGVLEALAQRNTWLGTEAEIDAAIDNVDRLIESFATAVCSEGDVFIIGEIRHFAVESAIPSGWQICHGQAISRTTFADLFAVIGDVYGVGDSSTTFNVPNYMGRTFVGATGSGDYVVGATGGEESVSLTIPNLPAHSHTGVVSPNNPVSNRAVVSTGGVQTVRTAGTSDNTGDGTAHENRMPFLVAHAAIYAGA